MDTQLDLLTEVVTHPGWKVVRSELHEQLSFMQGDLLTPATDEFDLIRKEGITKAMKELKGFFHRIETKVESFQRSVTRKT